MYYGFSLSQVSRHYDLLPCDSHKSFYGKAHVWELTDGTKVLQSYGTYVMRITPNGEYIRMWGGWSATTGRHIKSFCGLNKRGFTDLALEC